ncbi:hypothetical protein BLX24_03700 [Arsenicibacter rosenii]|uniref:Uncharacterized protein n=1 Tax=Arsenicibacter rosenii TaxID=1750698 RepID=A0A1S2VSR6_9BACT|nr:hypothetical protein BLX24_03700 [Arsenicibacter rosenii]
MYTRKPRKFENPKMTKKKSFLKHVMREAWRIFKTGRWLFFGEALRDAWMHIKTGVRKKLINVAQVTLF